MATYSGIDKVGEFFAHYGRKGMKRGRNIFNPDYKPVGEIAKGPQEPGAKLSNAPVQAKKSSGLAKAVNRNVKDIEKARRMEEWAKMVEETFDPPEIENGASERDFMENVSKTKEAYTLINKALGIKVDHDDRAWDLVPGYMSQELKDLVDNIAAYKDYVKKNNLDQDEVYEQALKNSNAEDGTKIRELEARVKRMIKYNRSRIKQQNKRKKEENKRQALLEAERKRQAAIDRR